MHSLFLSLVVAVAGFGIAGIEIVVRRNCFDMGGRQRRVGRLVVGIY